MWQLFQRPSGYLALFVSASVLGLLKAILAAPAIGPADFGVYTTVIILAALLSYVNSAGIFEAFVTQLNLVNPEDRRQTDRDTGLITTFILSWVTSGLALAAILFFFANSETGNAPLLTLSFLILTNLANVLMVELQATGRPSHYAFCLLLKAALPVTVLAWGGVHSFAALMAAEVVALLLTVGLALGWTGMPKLRRFSFSALQSLIGRGAPFTGSAALLNLSNNIDKWAVGFSLGSHALGTYALAAQIFAAGMAFASMVQVYAYPRLIAKHGMHFMSLFKDSLKLAIACFLVSATGLAILVIGARWAIPELMPDYRNAIPLLPIFSVAAACTAAMHADVLFRAMNKGGYYISMHAALLAAVFAAFAMLMLSGRPLIEYCIVFAAAKFAQLGVGYIGAYRMARSIDVR